MNRRILFVDDEPHILEGLRHRLHRQRNKWDMLFVHTGAEALEVIAREPIDVVVTDMRMPHMDGAALLEKVRDSHPRIVRIVLSGHAEFESALRVASVAHQFLAKPAEAGVIERVVERACGIQYLINQDSVRRVVGGIDSLPSLPKVYTSLVAALEHDKVSAPEVAKILRQDGAMCAKMLQLVNSAFFRLPRTISRVEEAVTYLGFSTIKQIVLAAEVFQYSGGRVRPRISMDALQAHALNVAKIASSFFDTKPEQEEAFVAGLLHDLGKLVLAVGLPDQVDDVLLEMKEQGSAMHAAELHVCGTTHAEVGGYLLGIWGLPYPIVEAVANHHDPMRVDTKEFGVLAATHIANGLVHELEAPPVSGDRYGHLALDLAYLNEIGVMDRLAVWRKKAFESVV